MINYRSEQRLGSLPSSTTTHKEVSAKPGKQFKKEIQRTKSFLVKLFSRESLIENKKYFNVASEKSF
jgi:hypothetical protein